jgi:hypothetical protein
VKEAGTPAVLQSSGGAYAQMLAAFGQKGVA